MSWWLLSPSAGCQSDGATECWVSFCLRQGAGAAGILGKALRRRKDPSDLCSLFIYLFTNNAASMSVHACVCVCFLRHLRWQKVVEPQEQTVKVCDCWGERYLVRSPPVFAAVGFSPRVFRPGTRRPMSGFRTVASFYYTRTAAS